MRYLWIADQLDVTLEEARFILDAIRMPFPAAARFGGQSVITAPCVIPARTTERVLRRTEIRNLVDQFGYAPSSRVLRDVLLCAGISVGHVTVVSSQSLR